MILFFMPGKQIRHFALELLLKSYKFLSISTTDKPKIFAKNKKALVLVKIKIQSHLIIK